MRLCEDAGIKPIPEIEELFYEADTRKHQQLVAKKMVAVAKNILDQAMSHDASKIEDALERESYIEPVWYLNTEEVPFGSNQYIELTEKMGAGWDHHKQVNDHHIEFFKPYSVQTTNDPIKAMDVFALIEMMCDWIAAASRRGNNPWATLDYIKKKYPIDEQLEAIIRNSLNFSFMRDE